MRRRIQREDKREHGANAHASGLCELGNQLIELEEQVEEKAVAVRIRELRLEHDELVERGITTKHNKILQQNGSRATTIYKGFRNNTKYNTNCSGLELKERKMKRKDKKRRARRAEEWSTCSPDSEEDYEEDDDDDNTTRGEERDCIRCGGG